MNTATTANENEPVLLFILRLPNGERFRVMSAPKIRLGRGDYKPAAETPAPDAFAAATAALFADAA